MNTSRWLVSGFYLNIKRKHHAEKVTIRLDEWQDEKCPKSLRTNTKRIYFHPAATLSSFLKLDFSTVEN